MGGMFPVLFSLGSFSLYTQSLFSALAFLVAAFIFWRRGKEEHYQEEELFDGFIFSSLVALFFGRAWFIIWHYRDFGWNIIKWLDVVENPGSVLVVSLVFATLYLYRFAARKKWDVFEIIDFWVLALAGGNIVAQIGNFFSGVGFGKATQLPWGVIYPGVFEKHHPVQLYSALFYIILLAYLVWVENHYRTFEWYRANKKTAQTGYLTSFFIISSSLFWMVMLLFKPSALMIGAISLDFFGYLAAFIVGSLLLFFRSGRSLMFWKKKEGSMISKFQV